MKNLKLMSVLAVAFLAACSAAFSAGCSSGGGAGSSSGGSSGSGISAVAGHRAAEIVDDDACPALGEQHGVGPADAAPGAGDDRDAAGEVERAQAVTATLAWDE